MSFSFADLFIYPDYKTAARVQTLIGGSPHSLHAASAATRQTSIQLVEIYEASQSFGRRVTSRMYIRIRVFVQSL